MYEGEIYGAAEGTIGENQIAAIAAMMLKTMDFKFAGIVCVAD